MEENFGYKVGKAVKALEFEDYYVWDCSVIKSGGKYHMFSSRWKKELGFGWNWCFNSEIIHSVSDTPEGPYKFQNVVLPRRGRQYFDGMNTHNTCIKEYNGKFYLYYMGCTYGGDILENPTVYTRNVTWEDGRMTKQGNLERPSILFDENGKPTHLFCASGDGSHPYGFETTTFIVCLKLEEV